MSWTLMSAPTEPVGASGDENTWCFYRLGLPGRLDLLTHLFEDLSLLVVVAEGVRLMRRVRIGLQVRSGRHLGGIWTLRIRSSYHHGLRELRNRLAHQWGRSGRRGFHPLARLTGLNVRPHPLVHVGPPEVPSH
jgi:hypothetical protein